MCRAKQKEECMYKQAEVRIKHKNEENNREAKDAEVRIK